MGRNWTALAVQRPEADSRRSADTHLVKLPLPGPTALCLNDESTHPTGSLKHRLARSLFLYALCNGWIGPATTVVEASSGSTAVSEASFARLIGVPFVAVMSRATSPAKIALIEREGGRCHLIDDPAAVSDAARLAAEQDGHFLDQFTYAKRARTGAAITTSPNRRWPRWPSRRTGYRRGSSPTPEPEVPRRLWQVPAAVRRLHQVVWWILRARPFPRPTRAERRRVPRRVSRGSAGREPRRRSCRASWTGCWESRTAPR